MYIYIFIYKDIYLYIYTYVHTYTSEYFCVIGVTCLIHMYIYILIHMYIYIFRVIGVTCLIHMYTSRLIHTQNWILQGGGYAREALRWCFFFSLEKMRSVAFTLQGISSNSLLWELVVGTKQFVSSNVHVIMTRHTCGPSSSMSAGSKRRALAFWFCLRICQMFLTSKCKGESDLVLCTTSVMANRMLPRISFAAKHVFLSGVATPQRHSFCKNQNCAQT